MSRDLFETALAELRLLYQQVPALGEFSPLPEKVDWADIAPVTVPGVEKFLGNTGNPNPETAALVTALRALAPYLKWNLSYNEDEVGAEFLQSYGWFELVGPHGHYYADATRVMFGYWSPGLWYGWHHHPAGELYYTLAGGATFLTEGRDPRDCVPGDLHEHAPFQNHAMQVNDEPIFAMAIWKGEGLAGPPIMGVA